MNYFFGTHPAVGEWKGIHTTTYDGGLQLDSSMKLSIFKDSRAIYEFDIVNIYKNDASNAQVYSCDWSDKGVNFIELKCKNSRAVNERIMTFKTDNFSESGSLSNHNGNGHVALLSRSSK